MALPCNGAVTRGELVSFNLDYYAQKAQRDAVARSRHEETERLLQERSAQSKERWGKRRERVRKFLDDLHWTVEAAQTYNDNIYRTPSRQKGDFITEALVSVDYISKDQDRRTSKLDSFLNFKSTLLGYNSYADENAGNCAVRTGLTYQLAPKYGITADYNGSKAQNAASEITGEPLQDIVDSWDHRFGGQVNANWGRLPWYARYEHEEILYPTEYDASQLKKDTFTFNGLVKILPKTHVLYQFEMANAEYPNVTGEDRTSYSYVAGVRGKLAPKLQGLVKAGISRSEYEGSAPEDNEEIGFTITYYPLQRLALTLEGERGIDDLPDGSARATSLELGVRYFPPFNKRLILSSNVSFDRYDEGTGADEDVLELKLAGDYRLTPWLKFGLAYTYQDKTATNAAAEYTQNILTLKGTLDF